MAPSTALAFNDFHLAHLLPKAAHLRCRTARISIDPGIWVFFWGE